MLKRYGLLALVLIGAVACSNCAPMRYDTQVYRIAVECIGGGTVGGTSAAVSPRHLITAKHVAAACEQAGLTTWKITAKDRDGKEYEVVVDKHAKSGADVTRLVIVGVEEPFVPSRWRETAYVAVEDYVCAIGLDNNDWGLAKECGYVSVVNYYYRDTTYIKVTAHFVPGFSGGSVWDENGWSIGVISRGSWDSGSPWFSLVVPVSEFRDLLVVEFSPDMG